MRNNCEEFHKAHPSQLTDQGSVSTLINPFISVASSKPIISSTVGLGKPFLFVSDLYDPIATAFALASNVTHVRHYVGQKCKFLFTFCFAQYLLRERAKCKLNCSCTWLRRGRSRPTCCWTWASRVSWMPRWSSPPWPTRNRELTCFISETEMDFTDLVYLLPLLLILMYICSGSCVIQNIA